MSFDQSIANTGYVLVEPDETEGLHIHEMGIFHTVSSPDMQMLGWTTSTGVFSYSDSCSTLSGNMIQP